MKRFPDWRPRLLAYVQSVARKPFEWGAHDCALFAAGGIEAMTGEDIGKPYRGKYKTLAGGFRLVKRKGFENHAEVMASLFEEIHPSKASVGDIAEIGIEGGIALGIVQGPQIYVLRPDQDGLGTMPLLSAARAFRVPFVEEQNKAPS